MSDFNLQSEFSPSGDQPAAISALTEGLEKGHDKQTLLGVTGSGKTFTMANVIQNIGKPTLVIAHNKTLAAQLAGEFEEFFPNNAVHYFVSYYDYYQPEAYLPTTDTYIEKDASINSEIDRLRHASTQALLTRNDVIIVASVSCIYGLGAPALYKENNLYIAKGDILGKRALLERLVATHYERTTADLEPGKFRAVGNKVEVMPASGKFSYAIRFLGNTITNIVVMDPVSSVILEEPDHVYLFPAKHFLTEGKQKERAVADIRKELASHLKKLTNRGLVLEVERLKRRTNYDLAMIEEIGYCSGIENYSRHLAGKSEGEPPETLITYFATDPETGETNRDFLTIIDESHVTVPQVRGMYAGDQARKKTLVEHGFRLPSALDNRPLQFKEFEERVNQQVYVSATPADFEKESSDQIVEQIIRPTGLVDPVIEVRPVTPDKKSEYPGQVRDVINEAIKEIKAGNRVLLTTLTKKMSEDLAQFLKDEKIKAEYLHSDVKTIDRIKILSDLRRGNFDVLVGVNLLREGLDLPEVTLVGILDADKAGFLRSETSLVQTIGRAARNVDGRVLLYADIVTDSMNYAMTETERRREIQLAYNKKHNITPKTIKKAIHDIAERLTSEHDKTVDKELTAEMAPIEKMKGNKKKAAIKRLIKSKEKQMNAAVKILEFETAAILRDEIAVLESMLVL